MKPVTIITGSPGTGISNKAQEIIAGRRSATIPASGRASAIRPYIGNIDVLIIEEIAPKDVEAIKALISKGTLTFLSSQGVQSVHERPELIIISSVVGAGAFEPVRQYVKFVDVSG